MSNKQSEFVIFNDKITISKELAFRKVRSFWKLAIWIWSAVIVAFLVSFSAGAALTSDPTKNFFYTFLQWLSGHGPLPYTQLDFLRIPIIIIISIFTLLSLLAYILNSLWKPDTEAEMQEIF